ncbi:MAG: hypothetical protein ACRC5T_03245 [Cetobacterium sp.]
MIDEKWKKKLLNSSNRSNEQEEREFLRLVDEAFNNCSLETARVLMKTFSNVEDYGTQERVCSVLATADEAIVIQSILEELPRLVSQAPEWAEFLLGLEIENRGILLEKIASQMPENIKKILRILLKKEDFQDLYPNSKNINF